jgi:traP protein
MIKEIKSIPLASFLSRLGHEPTARKGTRLWYKSPLRQEHTPSFKVETVLNCWYDFGLGRGGNIIDLAAELYQSTDLRHILRCIADRYPMPSVPTIASSFLCEAKRQGRLAPRHSAPSMERFEVVPLEHRALVAYLQERGIPAHIAKANCKEAHYRVNGKSYFAVTFENVSGGWELRNRYFKGCRGRKDISYLPWARDGPSTECAVFEGFIDYLSALTLGIISGADTIILNSVVNVNKAVSFLRGYKIINCYLDNDTAGQTALSELTAMYGSIVIDRSTLYSEFNDLNEYLTNQSFIKNKISNENK